MSNKATPTAEEFFNKWKVEKLKRHSVMLRELLPHEIFEMMAEYTSLVSSEKDKEIKELKMETDGLRGLYRAALDDAERYKDCCESEGREVAHLIKVIKELKQQYTQLKQAADGMKKEIEASTDIAATLMLEIDKQKRVINLLKGEMQMIQIVSGNRVPTDASALDSIHRITTEALTNYNNLIK